ncbi:hypothetical protein K438DRAFT_2167776 [Mycena galopus ATCC 62051]|nr:hypothetical protein K438DRAFT_2167776 [Mycena galopus ATCC 62051]
MPEIGWSQLRHRFTPGFEDILNVGVNNGLITIQISPRRRTQINRLFKPSVLTELNSYRDRINKTANARNRNKILPHGVPHDMYEHPNDYGVLDLKVIDFPPRCY